VVAEQRRALLKHLMQDGFIEGKAPLPMARCPVFIAIPV
jgi:hypothetical protein